MTSRGRCRCVIPAALAAAFTAGTAYSYHQYAARRDTIWAWRSAKLGLTRVDLSRPGDVTISLPHTPEVHHHGYRISLDPGAEPTPDQSPRGEVRVVDGPGEPVVVRLEDALRSESGAGGRLVWSTFPAPGAGCTVTVRVEEGSAALAGAESAVYARYAICELVALSALLWALTAWMAGVPAAVLWGVVLWRAARCYRTLPSPLRHDPAPDQAEPRVGTDHDLDSNSGGATQAGRGR